MSSSAATAVRVRSSAWTELVLICRLHIVLIAVAAQLVFGWLMTGRYLWALAGVVGLDWFFINIVNRVTDVAEDLKNGIPGTARVARHKRHVLYGAWGLMAASFAATHAWWPGLTPFRAAVLVLGLAYNFKLIPTLRGRTRFKEMYFFKNFASGALFVLTCFVYPLAVAPDWGVGPAYIAALVAFFLPFELSYEVLYDFRDIEGDRAEGVPTFPVVHGERAGRLIVDGLLSLSLVALAAGAALGAIGLRECLMAVAPLLQLTFYRPRLRRGLTSADCIALTNLGTAQLILFLVGTAVWLALGLPTNVFLR